MTELTRHSTIGGRAIRCLHASTQLPSMLRSLAARLRPASVRARQGAEFVTTTLDRGGADYPARSLDVA